MVDTQLSRERSLEPLSEGKLREMVLEVFCAEKTRWKRCYPPIGIDATLQGITRDPQKRRAFENLKEQLKSYATSRQISIEHDHTFFEEAGDRLYDDLTFYVRKIFPELKGISLMAQSGYFNSFDDDEIIQVYQCMSFDRDLFYGDHYSVSLQPIIFQFYGTLSFGASIAMILSQLGIEEEDCLAFRSLGLEIKAEALTRRMSSVGATLSQLHCDSIEGLRETFSNYPSVAAAVYPFRHKPSQIHFVVVDGILPDGVILRDPYHSWQILVKNHAFFNKWAREYPLLAVQLQASHSSSLRPM